jgi:ribosomal protein L7/L12
MVHTPLSDEARQAASSGNVIEAIKLTREHTGLGLKEAKDAVDAFLRSDSPPDAAGAAGSARSRNPRADIGDIPSSAVAFLYQGKLIDAIEQTRQEQRLGLKDAKETVERYLAANPSVNQRFKTAAAERSGGAAALIKLLLLIGLAVLGFLWLTGRL